MQSMTTIHSDVSHMCKLVMCLVVLMTPVTVNGYTCRLFIYTADDTARSTFQGQHTRLQLP